MSNGILEGIAMSVSQVARIKAKFLVAGILTALTVTVSATTLPVAAAEKLVTFEDIRKISPKAKKEYSDAIIAAEDQFKDAGITTRLRMAHFLSQIMTETGGL